MPRETLILASASPRRHQLLGRVYPHFTVHPCPLDEPRRTSEKVAPSRWAAALAYFKARTVAHAYPDQWVLGADTLVACGGQLLGKPRDRDDARAMLELQAACPSDVITGVCLLRVGLEPAKHVEVDVTRVWMRDKRALREDYLSGNDWAGKAGAYGIQNVGDRLIERIEGSFSNVVGLPLELLAKMLQSIGLTPGTAEADRQP